MSKMGKKRIAAAKNARTPGDASPKPKLAPPAPEGPPCSRCGRTGWVCEVHDDRPWDGKNACGCGGAGMPCPICNPSDEHNMPRLPAGFRADQS